MMTGGLVISLLVVTARVHAMGANPKEGHCAVQVTVTYPGGLPARTPVELLDAAGKVVARTETWEGKASFCDFGFGEHTILVGGDRCGSVAVRRVRLQSWPQQFFVTWNSCGDQSGGRYPPSCRLYLRVSSTGGTKLPAAVTAPNDPRVIETDKYGRLWVGVPEGTTQEMVITAVGHKPERVQIACHGERDIEQAVVLVPEAP